MRKQYDDLFDLVVPKYVSGMTAREIGTAIGIGRSHVISVLSAAKRRGIDITQKPKAEAKQKLALLSGGETTSLLYRLHSIRFGGGVKKTVKGRKELKSVQQCRWIDKPEDGFICDRPHMADSSYCRAHHARCYYRKDEALDDADNDDDDTRGDNQEITPVERRVLLAPNTGSISPHCGSAEQTVADATVR